MPAGDLSWSPVLDLAPPAELGVLRDRRPRRRHIAATVLDLAARGHLGIADAGNDPEIGEALDWLLVLPEQPLVAAATATPGAGVDDVLRPHERAVLDLVTATPSRLLSRVRSAAALLEVMDTASCDTVGRGWLRRRGPVTTRTATGRLVHADLRAARARLDTEARTPEVTAQLLPQAVALGLGALWAARLGQQRPPVPGWFTPGPSMSAHGWLGVTNAGQAMAAAPPPGGGAGSAMSSPGGGWG